MSAHATVLYDAPGPKARVRNLIIGVVFALAVIALFGYLILLLNNRFELAPSKWQPFFQGNTWTTFLLPALGQTLLAAGLSLIIALPIGALLGLGRLSMIAWVRWPCAVIVEFFRAIPVLLMMVFATVIYNAISIADAATIPLLAVVTGLVLYNGSVLAEVFRSGVLSLPRGQTEASLALGLRRGQMMRMILLPQALTAMLPAIVSQLVVIVKDTALGGQLIVAYPELLRSARSITGNYGNTVATYIVIALIFIVINFALTSFASWLERTLRKRRGGRTKAIEVTAAATGVPAVT